MFADGRTRITLLAVVFITSMMLTFSDSFFSAPERIRTRSYLPEKKAVELTSLAISSFRDGVMITGARDAMRVDLVTCDQKTRSCSHSKNIAFNPAEEPDIPLLNLKISPDKKAIGDYLHKQTHYLRRSEVYGDRPLVPVTYIMTEQKGDLRVSAMFMGQVQSQLCDMQGRCLIIFSDYTSYGKEYVFYSRDGGQQWQWLSQWTMPEPAGETQLLAITEPGSVLMVQRDTLYQTRDSGKHWRPLFSMDNRKKRYQDDGRWYTSLSTTKWHYNGDARVIAWMKDEQNDPENTILACFNTQTSETESDQVVPGEIDALDSTTGGSYINGLQGGSDDLLIAGSGSETRISDDGGLNWNTAAPLAKEYGETVLFDKWRNRLFYFQESHYSNSLTGNRDGIEYKTSAVQ
ncbi:hypothetical protein [Morganella morganii]